MTTIYAVRVFKDRKELSMGWRPGTWLTLEWHEGMSCPSLHNFIPVSTAAGATFFQSEVAARRALEEHGAVDVQYEIVPFELQLVNTHSMLHTVKP